MTVQPTLTFTDIVDGEPVEAATWIPIHSSIKSHANAHTHDEYALSTDLSTVPLLQPASDARNVFSGPSGRLVITGKVTGDANNRLQIDSTGKLSWGDGTIAPDVNLYRSAATTIRTDQAFTVGTNLSVLGVTSLSGFTSITRSVPASCLEIKGTGDAQPRLAFVNSPRIDFGSGSAVADVSILRSAAGQLTFGTSTQKVGLQVFGSVAGDSSFQTRVTTDAQPRFVLGADGKLFWGDGTLAADTSLARTGVAQLSLTGALVATGAITTSLTASASAFTATAAANQFKAQAVGSVGSGVLLIRLTADVNDRFQIWGDGTHAWGPGTGAADLTLARTAAGVLSLGTQTQAARLRLFAGSTGAVAYDATVAAEALPRFYISGAGAHFWGDGTLTQDCQLFRNSAGELRTADTFLAVVRAANTSTAFSAHATGDGQRRFLIDARGQQFWGDGTNPADTVLYRRGAKEIGLLDTWLTVHRTNATDLAYRSLLSAGDTFARLQIDVNGTHNWGPGTSAADATLTRNSPGYMIFTLANALEVSGGAYIIQRGADFTTGLYLQGTGASVQAPRILFRDNQATPKRIFLSKSGDQLLAILDDGGNQRVSFDVGGTNRPTILPGSLNLGGDAVSQGVISLGVNGYVSARAAAGAGSATFVSRVTGDAQDRFNLWADGRHVWGDGTLATDVSLYRIGSTRLYTDAQFQSAGGAALIGFTYVQAAAAGSMMASYAGGAASARIAIAYDGRIYWGDGTAAADTVLRRRQATELSALNTFLSSERATAASTAFATIITGEGNYRLVVRADGLLQWSDGTAATDTTLARTGVGVLTLTGALTITGAVDTPNVKAASAVEIGLGGTGGTDSAAVRFYRNIIIGDTKNFIFSGTTGTKIGTANTQKIGFYNATPIVQPAGTPAAATDLTTVVALANALRTALLNLGLVA